MRKLSDKTDSRALFEVETLQPPAIVLVCVSVEQQSRDRSR